MSQQAFTLLRRGFVFCFGLIFSSVFFAGGIVAGYAGVDRDESPLPFHPYLSPIISP
jgi:hypothetical protein